MWIDQMKFLEDKGLKKMLCKFQVLKNYNGIRKLMLNNNEARNAIQFYTQKIRAQT